MPLAASSPLAAVKRALHSMSLSSPVARVPLELDVGDAPEAGLAEEPEAQVAHLGVPVGDVVAAETLALGIAADDALGEVELRCAVFVEIGVVAAQQVVGPGDHLEQHDLDAV